MTAQWRSSALVLVIGGVLSAWPVQGEQPGQSQTNLSPSRSQPDSGPPARLEERVKELEKLVDEQLKEEARVICAKRWPYFENAQKTCERHEYEQLRETYRRETK